MYQKNLIQQKLEEIDKIGKLRDHVNNICNNYTVQHACFGLNNGQPCELENGYMGTCGEYDNLDDCLSDISSCNNCVMVEMTPHKEGRKHSIDKKYTLGVFFPDLSTCTGNQVIDLSNLEVVM